MNRHPIRVGMRGLLVVSRRDPKLPGPHVPEIDHPHVFREKVGTLEIVGWGSERPETWASGTILFNRGPRQHEQDLSAADVRRMVEGKDTIALRQVLPTFGAAVLAGETAIFTTDALGFFHVYYFQSAEWSAVSTSARVIRRCLGEQGELDRDGLAVQALLGWQLGERTLYAGISKLPAGSFATVAGGRIELTQFGSKEPFESIELDDAVSIAARNLRQQLAAFLDDHPSAALQLTGGQDSRILLSAIPPQRRKDLTVVTLSAGGDDQDVAIAAGIARRYHMRHVVASLGGLDSLSPGDAHEHCLTAGRRIEAMADPLAFVSSSWAEKQFDQGSRISGLGGEVARGFYYLGRSWNGAVTRRRTERLASWRMFANESVVSEAFDPEFASNARSKTLEEIHGILLASGRDWLSATDEFYLDQRMQRWAGVVDSAVCWDRDVCDPMLDDRFLDLARALPPESKSNALFLGRLQVALDEELANVPLDARPSPRTYGYPSVTNKARVRTASVVKLGKKVSQRVRRVRRPAAGATVVTGKVLQHWRSEPSLLDDVRGIEILSQEWIDRVLNGTVEPEPSAVALLVNLMVAIE